MSDLDRRVRLAVFKWLADQVRIKEKEEKGKLMILSISRSHRISMWGRTKTVI